MRMATVPTYPSFMYWVSQGATSCWENWSGSLIPSIRRSLRTTTYFSAVASANGCIGRSLGSCRRDAGTASRVCRLWASRCSGRVFTVRGPWRRAGAAPSKRTPRLYRASTSTSACPSRGRPSPHAWNRCQRRERGGWGDEVPAVWNRFAVRPPPAVAGLISITPLPATRRRTARRA